jgi:GTP-binding protein
VVKPPQAEFVVSAMSPRDFPRNDLPEIVLAGRSNVGKSSLVNRLVARRNLARTSSTPGKTQSINFYRLNGSFFLVDLPGYGYAKASRAAARQWGRLIEQYLQDRPCIVLVIHLVDARIPPTQRDLDLAAWIDRHRLRRALVATKIDKLSGSQRVRHLEAISRALGGLPVIGSSAVTGAGFGEIWQRVEEAARGA